MCLEDVLLDRRKLSNPRVKVASTTAGPFLGPDDNRVAMIISAPSSGFVTICNTENLTGFGGIVLWTGQDPLVLTIENAGNFIRKPT